MKAKQDKKQPRNQYSSEFKKQALDRADKDGVATVAKDLGIRENRLYTWRQKRRLAGLTTEEETLQQGEITRLKREMARLEEDNASLKKAAAYFAKQPSLSTP